MNFLTYLWQLDRSLLLWFQSIRQEWMTPFWKFVTSLGDAGWFWIALALFLLCFRSTRRAGLGYWCLNYQCYLQTELRPYPPL